MPEQRRTVTVPGKYALAYGDITSGFEFVGPFDTYDEAASWNDNGRGWIIELAVPKLS